MCSASVSTNISKEVKTLTLMFTSQPLLGQFPSCDGGSPDKFRFVTRHFPPLNCQLFQLMKSAKVNLTPGFCLNRKDVSGS